MAAVTIEIDLPPHLTVVAYQRHGDGHAFEISWPLPTRCRCDACRRDGEVHLEFKDTAQVVRDLDNWGQPSFWVCRPAFHRCVYCNHRQYFIPPFKRKDVSYTVRARRSTSEVVAELTSDNPLKQRTANLNSELLDLDEARS